MKKHHDPLAINFKDTTTSLVKGAITLAVVVPLVLGVSKIIGGNK